MQGLQKVMRIVIFLGFCGMMSISSGIVLVNIVGTVNQGICVVERVVGVWLGYEKVT